MTKEEIFKRIFKPLYVVPTLGITSCFLLLVSKENNNYKFYRFTIFIYGFIILVISEMSASLSGKSNTQVYFFSSFTFNSFY